MFGLPARLTESNSATPFGWLVSVRVADASWLLSTSLTVALAPRLTGPEPGLSGAESSVKATGPESIPPPPPFMSTTGGAVSTWVVAGTGGVFEAFEPAVTHNVTVGA